jgi:hypothetical protein
MRTYLVEEDIRNFILDRTIEDNELQLDLTYSSEEISDAMVRAGRDYNSVPPFTDSVHPGALPADTNLFLYGTAYHLFLSRISKLSRNDIDYTAGNVGTNPVAKQLQHLQFLAKEMRAEFKEMATHIKVAINVRESFGQIG